MYYNSDNYRNFPLLRPDLIPLFWSKIDKSGSTPESRVAMLAGRVNSPCHLWTAGLYKKGYGRFPWKELGKTSQPNKCRAHVLAYFLVNNDLPQERGLQLDHLCRIRYCCNPDHLEPVIGLINTNRGISTKLTDGDVSLIKYLHNSCYGWSTYKISRMVGISRQQVSNIICGKSRKAG